ncbi:MAG: hypothetical protein BYD32DRAFT_424136 [Podila humilis]|nr:MAG: hypothetical protein BYD32DRAFT_424136 [Podila humilis]
MKVEEVRVVEQVCTLLLGRTRKSQEKALRPFLFLFLFFCPHQLWAEINQKKSDVFTLLSRHEESIWLLLRMHCVDEGGVCMRRESIFVIRERMYGC